MASTEQEWQDAFLCARFYTERKLQKHARKCRARGDTPWEMLDKWCARISVRRRVFEITYTQMRRSLAGWYAENPMGRLWKSYGNKAGI